MAPTLPPPEQRPMIVTAWIAEEDLAPFTAIRQRFFPADRNYLEAHLTLFHHIPATLRSDFLAAARKSCEALQSHTLRVLPPFLLGRGVAYGVEAGALGELREALRREFSHALTPQDDRSWKRPHLTVQNKVTSAAARHLHRHLLARYLPCQLRVRGLYCYTYDGGPWTPIDRLPFGKP
ncbi:2'-5' RNA ligase family protein [Neolewinella litorea]|uniref:2'-5' RNA ligase family protein n=1 Tax=Neolewinella litorea TaxID=2562452 RepID=A0A4S4NS39_9BACT|nr:2'-5' RNA ligase family protein [Neolewinella litorea]THH41228.1 2'-5' RNA ligase family protein [Neolewinella litorea]